MQISALPAAYPAFSSTAVAAPRGVESASSADLSRAAFSPVASAQAGETPRGASADQEQDRPAESATPAGKGAGEQTRSASEEQQLRLEIAELANRDQEVRTHEQAHAAVGGQHAGAPTYTYTRGPDGKRYATGGEVSIDVSKVPDDPQATLSKMQIVQRAALAPAEPSAQDRRVAAQAQAQMAVARVELATLQREEAQRAAGDESAEKTDDPSVTPDAPASRVPPAGIDLYSRTYSDNLPAPSLDLRA